MIGLTVSHYQIIEKLGEGGMGAVYKAKDLKLERFVALKFLLSYSGSGDEEKQRFIHEARAASMLDHPNIGTIYEVEETGDGRMFIAMAFYEGGTLKKRIDKGPLQLNEAIDIAVQVAQGLARAHEAGIIHRDIKPANIMVTNRIEVKIVDFGLSKLIGAAKLTKSGMTMGTVGYLSPEQARGQQVDHRADIWSLGVVLYEMTSGTLPFKSDYPEAAIYSILNETPQPLTSLRTGVPMDLERIVSKAMAKQAGERYQHLDDMIVDLKRLGNVSTNEENTSADFKPNQGLTKKTKKKVLAAIVAFLFLVTVIFLSGQYLGVWTPEREALPDSLFLFAIRDTLIHSPVFHDSENTKYYSISDSSIKVLHDELESRLILIFYPRYLLITVEDIEKRFARAGKVPPEPGFEPDFFAQINCKGGVLVSVSRMESPQKNNQLIAVVRFQNPRGDVFSMFRSSDITELASEIGDGIQSEMERQDKGEALGYAITMNVLQVNGDKIVVRIHGGPLFRKGTPFDISRVYKPWGKALDSGVVERLSDLEDALKYYDEHKGSEDSINNDPDDYFWTHTEYEDLKSGYLRLPSSALVLDLGMNARLEEVFDSTAVGRIVSKKYPWVAPKPGDWLTLRR